MEAGTVASPGIVANGNGDVLLQAISGAIDINAAVQSSASIELNAANLISIDGEVTSADSLVVTAGVITTSANVNATNDILMQGQHRCRHWSKCHQQWPANLSQGWQFHINCRWYSSFGIWDIAASEFGSITQSAQSLLALP